MLVVVEALQPVADLTIEGLEPLGRGDLHVAHCAQDDEIGDETRERLFSAAPGERRQIVECAEHRTGERRCKRDADRSSRGVCRRRHRELHGTLTLFDD